MKKILALTLALVLCFGLVACGSSNAESDGTTNKQGDTATADTVAKEYVGEWKAKVISSLVDGEYTYKVAVIMLHPDGTATYRGKEATWEYKGNAIHLAVSGAGVAVLEIAEEDGKTVLNFYDATYYRASEFAESNS